LVFDYVMTVGDSAVHIRVALIVDWQGWQAIPVSGNLADWMAGCQV